MFIPCIEGRCPERMQLLGYQGDRPVYRCERRVGEKYASDCYYHTHPFPASELNEARWVRDAGRWESKKQNGEVPTSQDLETAV
jgi:hypothetical protein